MSWTYDDDFKEALYKWDALPDNAAKNNLATRLLKRLHAILEEDCGHIRLGEARITIRPHIPEQLK